MDIKELLEFIKVEHKRLMEFYGVKDSTELKYPTMVKIMEELGELSEAILLQDKFQRIEKIEHNETKIDEEFADVLITVLILAENMNIDIVDALKKKISKIKKRSY